MLSKIRCGMHRLPRRFPLPSAADLKFLQHLPQTRLGTSNRKQPWTHGLTSAGFRSSRDGVVGRYHELRKRALASPWQDRRDATRPARSAIASPWDNLSEAGLQPHRVLGRQWLRQQRTLTMRRLGLAIVAALIARAPASAQANCRNTGNFDRWLADFKREALAQGISPARLGGRRALPGARPAHHQHRPRAALLRADLPGDVRQDAAGRPAAGRRRQDQAAPGPVRARGEGIRRAGPGDHRVLGPRERFRRRPGQGPVDQVADHARL